MNEYRLAFSFSFFEVPGRKLIAIRKKSNVSMCLLSWTGNLRQKKIKKVIFCISPQTSLFLLL